MDNNQFDATTFIPVIGLLTGGSQTQAKTLEIEFKGETVSKWTSAQTVHRYSHSAKKWTQ